MIHQEDIDAKLNDVCNLAYDEILTQTFVPDALDFLDEEGLCDSNDDICLDIDPLDNEVTNLASIKLNH